MTGQRTWKTPFFTDEPLPVDYDFDDPDGDGLAEWPGQGGVLWDATSVDNELNPRLNPNTLLQPEVIDPKWDATDKIGCVLFIPSSLMKQIRADPPLDPIPVTVLLGAGNEELGYGLRYYFQRAGTGPLLCLSGREGGNPGGRWNVGISQKTIEGLFASNGFKGKPEVQVSAGYSTGFGVVQMINSDLVPLAKVKRLVLFDCIYRCDKPALPPSAPRPLLLTGDLPEFGPPPAGQVLLDEKKEAFFQKPFNTRRAIARLTGASPDCLIAGYSATVSGSPRYALWTIGGEKPVLRGSHPVVALPVLAELRSEKAPPGSSCSPSEAFEILVLSRYLQLGADAGLIKADDPPASFRTIIAAGLPPRGSVFSCDAVKALVNLPPGLSAGIDLVAWASAIPVRPTGAERVTASRLIREHHLVLPEWDYNIRTDLGEFRHAGPLLEFGWELLPP